MNYLRIKHVMCVMSKNLCLRVYPFCPLSRFSHSVKSMTLRGNVEVRKVQVIFGEFIAHSQRKQGDLSCYHHSSLFISGLKVPRHSSLPEEISVRRLIKFIDIDHSQRGYCRTNSNILIYKNVNNDQYINL